MVENIISFRKACEEITARQSDGHFFIKASDDTMAEALWAARELFGYLSMTEHYHAAYTRFGEDIFEGVNTLVLGGLMHEKGSLILERAHAPSDDDYRGMSVRDLWVTNKKPSDPKGCEVHSLVWNGAKPYIVIREEMKTVLPQMHGVMMDCVQRLQAKRPFWADLIEDPNLTLIRPPPS